MPVPKTVGERVQATLDDVPLEVEVVVAVAAVVTYFIGHVLISPDLLAFKVDLAILTGFVLVGLTRTAQRLRVPSRPFRTVLLLMLALRGAVILTP